MSIDAENRVTELNLINDKNSQPDRIRRNLLNRIKTNYSKLTDDIKANGEEMNAFLLSSV